MTGQIDFVAMGGLGETGSLNCMLYESETTAIVVDCGIGFPEGYQPGVNVMIPSFEALERVRHKLHALVLTHGHEDHAGAVAGFTQRFDLPIYATAFTQGIVRQKLDHAGHAAEMHLIEPGKTFEIGDFRIEPIFVNHSIVDTVALLVHQGEKKALHLTDFKIDSSAPEGKVTDLARLKQLGEEGLDLLLMDSTNAFSTGRTNSEMTVRDNLIDRFTKIKGRIIVCLFASNVMRLQSLLECARVTGRKVALTGRSTKEYSAIARSLGYMDLSGIELYDVEDIHQFADSEVLVIATGSQGEPRSVLQRMSESFFKPFRIREGDTVIFSSKKIPGNEGQVYAMMNRLSLQGAHIIAENMGPAIHASGHAKQEELKEIFRLVKPKHFVPIHGEFMHLQQHCDVAFESGLTEKQVKLVLNGDRMRLNGDGLKNIGLDETDRVFLTDEGHVIAKDAVKKRKKMAFHGLVAVSLIYDAYSPSALRVELKSYGLIGEEEEELLQDELKQKLLRDLENDFDQGPEHLQKLAKVETRHFFKDKFAIRPEVLVLMHEV